MFVTISKQLNGANLEASAYLRDNIRNRCPMQAKTPIAAIIDHSFRVGLTQTKGIVQDIIMAPTKPVNKSVKSGLSEVLNLRVIIK